MLTSVLLVSGPTLLCPHHLGHNSLNFVVSRRELVNVLPLPGGAFTWKLSRLSPFSGCWEFCDIRRGAVPNIQESEEGETARAHSGIFFYPWNHWLLGTDLCVYLFWFWGCSSWNQTGTCSSYWGLHCISEQGELNIPTALRSRGVFAFHNMNPCYRLPLSLVEMNMVCSNEEVGLWNLIVIIQNSSEQTAVLAVGSEEYTHWPC